MPKDGSHTGTSRRRLGPAAISRLARGLPGWRVVRGHHLTKTFRFDDFAQALAFVNRCGSLAERLGHHPDVFLKWGRVRLTVYTHSIRGLSKADFMLAAKIDRMPRGTTARRER